VTQTAPPPIPADTSFGLWGPPGPDAEEPKVQREKPRKAPWGLGQVWFAVAAMVGVQFAVLPVVLFEAVKSLNAPVVNEAAILAALEPEALSAASKTASVIVSALILQWAVFVGMPWLTARRHGLRSLAADFGLRFRRWDPLLGFALAAALQVLMMGIGWLLANSGLDLSGSDNTNMVTDHDGAMLALMVLAAAVGAPLTEELFFRGLTLRAMLRSFAHVDLSDDPEFAARAAANRERTGRSEFSPGRRRIGVIAAAVLSSAFFGIMHTPLSDGTNEVSLAAQIVLPMQTGLLGLVFALVAIKTRRLGLVICAHVVFNSTSLALVMFTR
jgi:hypothetical protein